MNFKPFLTFLFLTIASFLLSNVPYMTSAAPLIPAGECAGPGVVECPGLPGTCCSIRGSCGVDLEYCGQVAGAGSVVYKGGIISTRQSCTSDQTLVTFKAAAATFTLCVPIDGTVTSLPADQSMISVTEFINEEGFYCDFNSPNISGDCADGEECNDYILGAPSPISTVYCCSSSDNNCINKDPF